MVERASGSGDRADRLVAAVLLSTLVLCLLAGCATGGEATLDPAAIVPLELPEGRLTVADAERLVETPELLAIDEEMRRFVHLYTHGLREERQRLRALHRSVKSPGMLDLDYDPGADGSAIEVFRRGSANCLSYANLFVALAREAGLDADYQWLEVRPQWSRLGENVAVRLHVNVVVDTRGGDQFMVDIDPLESRDIAGSRRLKDNEAAALHHNNLAMQALGDDRLGDAWAQLVTGLQIGPGMTPLWVNLGAVYRRAGQHRAAETSYLQALSLDPRDRSAMTNLMVLYEMEGRSEEQARWAARVERYRSSNPYYHAWLGEQAADAEDWAAASQHLEQALVLAPEESHLLYAAGIAHYRMQDYQTAADYLTRAIESAALVRDQERYRQQLETVRQEQLAGL